MDNSTALIIIDIQNDYFEGGANPLNASLEASLKAKEILRAFREKEYFIIHIQHISRQKDKGFFLSGTKGAEIHENVKPVQHERVITKHYPNIFKETELLDLLKTNAINNLVICGMMTHMCIDSSVRTAHDCDYSTTVISDACATKDLEYNGKKAAARDVQTAFLAALNGMFAEVKTAEEFLKEFNS